MHVFVPSPDCTNCSLPFVKERPGFTVAGALRFRGEIAKRLNELTREITGRPPISPINESRAEADPDFNQCTDSFGVVAGAPANYHSEPCIFEVDAVKERGPFTDPATGLGYPNYSFLLPGAAWLPGLYASLRDWLIVQQGSGGQYGQYTVLLHPNTGCEGRDHAEERSIEWLGGERFPLSIDMFSCHALGCNQACVGEQPLPPANCSSAD